MFTTIGIDPQKATHTAVAIDESEAVLGEITVPADRHQTKKLTDWASELPRGLGNRVPLPDGSDRAAPHPPRCGQKPHD